MRPGLRCVLGTILTTLTCRAGGSAPPPRDTAASFAVANIHFEQNATDGDAEVVIEAMGGDAGLASLTVIAPDGRTIVSASAPDTSTMGVRQFRFESPEPRNVGRLKTAYPEGTYDFTGATAAGKRFVGAATLSHRLPPAVAVLTPADEADGVTVTGARVTWTPVAGVAGYAVTIEQPERNFSLSITLPASATAFAVPDGVLQPGQEYTLAVGTFLPDGNASFVETTFATADKE